MSIWAVSWAFRTPVSNPTHKLVLLALADFADDQDEAFPKVSTLMEMASTGRRTVFRALDALEEAGLITRIHGFRTGANGGGRRQVNSVYKLAVPDSVSRRNSGRESRPTFLQYVDPEPSQPVDETASEVRGDMDVTPEGETPSQLRGDTGDTAEIRGDMGDTIRGDTGDTPNKEPSGYNHQTPPTPLENQPDLTTTPRRVRSGQVRASTEDWNLVRSCLPDSMQSIDDKAAADVAAELRLRIEAGWKPQQLLATLEGNPLPATVRSVRGIVLHRISQIPVDAAPPRPSWGAKPSCLEEPKIGGDARPAFLKAREEARNAGRPEARQSALWWSQHYVDGELRFHRDELGA